MIPVITVNGTFRNAAGDPMSGTLKFRLNAPLVDSVGNVVSERVEITSTLDSQGRITDTDGTTVGLVLYCTSGGDIAPAGLLYDVAVAVGSRAHRVSVALPDSLGSTVDWADIVPVPASTGVVWTVPDLTPEQARDLIGTTLIAGAGLSKTVDDPGDTVALGVDFTAVASDARVDALEATAAALPGTYVPQDLTALAASSAPDNDDQVYVWLDGTPRRVAVSDLLALAAGGVSSVDGLAGAVDLTSKYLQLGDLPPSIRAPRSGPGSVVTNFESGHGFGTSNVDATSNVNDNTDFVTGSQAAKIVTKGDDTASILFKNGGTAFNAMGKVIRLLIKLDDVTHVSFGEFRAGSGGAGTDYYSWNIFGAGGAYFTSGDWVVLTLNWHDATTVNNPNRAALTDLRLQFLDDNTGNKITFHLDGIWTAPDGTEVFPNGVVSITFDDNYIEQKTIAKPILDTYGYAPTVYVIKESADAASPNYLSTAQLKVLRDTAGWEIGAHAATAAAHNAAGGFTSLSAAQLDAEIATLKQWMVDNGFRGLDHFAYPQGFISSSLIDGMREFVASARTTHKRTHETWPPGDSMRLRSMSVANTDTPATVTAQIDLCKQNGSWLILDFHKIVSSGASVSTEYNLADFQTIVDYIAASGVPVKTVGEVLELRRPAAPPVYDGLISGYLGDGSDGNVVVTGTTTLARDMYYDTLVVQSGGVLIPNGYRIYCRTLCWVQSGGKIHVNGTDGAAVATAGSGYAAASLGASGNGGAGGTAAGTAGTSVNPNSYGGAGGAGGLGSGGAGGASGSTGPPAAGQGTPRVLPAAANGILLGNAGQSVVRGGGGGGGGGGDGTAGGGGAGGGGVILITAREIRNDGAIEAKGGVGGSPAAGNRGGGGGGGGGTIILTCLKRSGSGGTVSVAGGSGGIKTGTGVNGVLGATGTIFNNTFGPAS